MNSGASSEIRKPRLVAERPVNSAAEAISLPPLPPPLPPMARADQPLTPSGSAYRQQILATMQALAMILSARATVLLAVTGAFVLALLAVFDPTPLKLYVTIGYYVGVVVPAVALYWRTG